MYRGKNVTVIIGAAGEGLRMGSALPKQFLKIGEKTILEMAIAPFEQTPEIDGDPGRNAPGFCDVLQRVLQGVFQGGGCDSWRQNQAGIHCQRT